MRKGAGQGRGERRGRTGAERLALLELTFALQELLLLDESGRKELVEGGELGHGRRE